MPADIRQRFSPEMPRSVIIVFNWAFISILMLFSLQLLFDLSRVAARLVSGVTLQVPVAVSCALACSLLLIAAAGVRNALVVPS